MAKLLRRTLSLAVLHQSLNDFTVIASSGSSSGSSSCTLCLQTPDIPKPQHIATSDGKTCEQLSVEAQAYSLDDDRCLSHYQLLGYTECGCDLIMPDDHSPPSNDQMCTLCHDGSIPSSSDSITFDSDPNTSTTCTQAIDYLHFYHQTSVSCNNFQYKGVVNCGCPLYTINPQSDPACSLCANDGEKVSDSDRKIFTLNDPTGTTCGIMEFILAADIDGLYNNGTCSDLQTYFGPLCPCEFGARAPIVTPQITRSPTPIPTTTYPSSGPTMIPSRPPITQQPSNSTDNPSPSPSSRESSIPTMSRNESPSTEPSHHPTKEHSQHPSSRPTYLPTISLAPSVSPTTIFDKKANCTALTKGIKPLVTSVSERVDYELIFDLVLKAKKDSTSGRMGTYETARKGLQEAFQQKISPIAAGCDESDGNSLQDKIHFVEMEEMKSIAEMGCRSSNLPENSSNLDLDIWCVPVSSTINIYYSSIKSRKRRRLNQATVKAYVEEIVNDEFPELALSVSGVFDAALASDTNNTGSGGSNLKSSPAMNVGIAVGLGCSFALIIAIGIVARERRKDNSAETTHIIAGTHIRSDDSISDNPTISSGRRGMMMGWEGSISDRSNNDTRSDVSSKRSQSVHTDDHSRGLETRHRIHDASYLPASVLKDLLGTEDVEGISIGEDNDGLSFAPYDEVNNVHM